jgi:hypothetical protein
MDVDRYLTGVPVRLFQPDVMLPAQQFPAHSKREPEHRLMMAVLEAAVRCVRKYPFPTDARGRRLFHEARQWLLAAEPNWPYSFERICAVLDLDADAVRQQLRLVPGMTSMRSARVERTTQNPIAHAALEGGVDGALRER